MDDLAIIDIGLINKNDTSRLPDIILEYSVNILNHMNSLLPEITNHLSMSGTSIIFNNFKDNISEIQYDNLINIFIKFL